MEQAGVQVQVRVDKWLPESHSQEYYVPENAAPIIFSVISAYLKSAIAGSFFKAQF